MKAKTATFFIAILALMFIVSACNTANPNNTGNVKDTTKVDVTATTTNPTDVTPNPNTGIGSNGTDDLNSDLNVSSPQDPGVLDDINVSDDIPQ